MTKTFRQAFNEILEETQISIAEISRGTGVSKDQMHKLKQGSSRSTNVEDAQKIAAYLNMTLDEFLGVKSTKEVCELERLWQKLSDEDRKCIIKVMRGLIATNTPTQP